MPDKFPLAWPAGWPRSRGRKAAQFGKSEMVYREGAPAYRQSKDLTMDDAVKRLAYELERLGVNVLDDSIISSNLRLNMSGRPRGDQGEPGDPGVAVYFQKKGGPMRVIAIDAYTRVRDNIAAVAATLEAMRAIERHGGAQILERAFTGFDALPAPKSCWDILGVPPGSTDAIIRQAYRQKAKEAGAGNAGENKLAELNVARDDAIKLVGSLAR